jgi:hypothetical protein
MLTAKNLSFNRTMHCLDWWFSAGGQFLPLPQLEELFDNIWRELFLLSKWGMNATGLCWVEGRNGPKHPMRARIALYKKNDNQAAVVIPTLRQLRWED